MSLSISFDDWASSFFSDVKAGDLLERINPMDEKPTGKIVMFLEWINDHGIMRVLTDNKKELTLAWCEHYSDYISNVILYRKVNPDDFQ